MIFKREKNYSEEELTLAIDNLNATKNIDGYTFPDTEIRAKSVKIICSANYSLFSKKMLKNICSYIKSSPAYISADLIEDEFGIEFDQMNTDFEVNYKGKYTFVPNKWLPKVLVQERNLFGKIIGFFLQKAPPFKKKTKIKNINIPMMNFSKGKMNRLELDNVVLYTSKFQKMELETIMFYESDLSGAKFSKCSLSSVRFIDTSLDDVEFIDCDFDQSEVQNVENTTFKDCVFYETNFFHCKGEFIGIETCDFEGCWFSFCDLGKVTNLTQEQLNSCLGDDNVVLPKHLKKPDFWPKKADVYTWDTWLESGEINESNATLAYE
ncbi:pentapeptide repeat-containing protein [Aquimarina pacifica]|uniref:pentapeptide repeat-containing protein n=1 Tax=Aquimarina pacifica TaxID=1296415 RepID=UPI00046FB8BD|nr:pentapeptide repeat-containing protein [Aquimarina pacifica]